MGLLDKLWTTDKKDDSSAVQPQPARPEPGSTSIVARRPPQPIQLPGSMVPPLTNSMSQQQSPESSPFRNVLGNAGAEPAGDLLQLLRSKTDFDSTDIGRKVAHEMKPLEALGSAVTEAQKVAVVLKSGAEDGLTGHAIVETYDKLLGDLEAQKSSFDQIIANSRADQIERPRQQIADKTLQVTKLQEEIAQLGNDMAQATMKISSNESRFAAAYDQRKLELQQAQQHYSSIIEGIHS